MAVYKYHMRYMKLSNLYKPVYQQTLNIGIKYSANNMHIVSNI